VGADLDVTEQEAVQAHLEGCGTCRTFAEAAREARAVFQTLDPGDPPAGLDLWPALRGQLVEEGLLVGSEASERPLERTPVLSMSRWRRLAVGSLAAAAALFVTVQVAHRMNGGPERSELPGLADVNHSNGTAPTMVAFTMDDTPVFVDPGSELRLATDEDARMMEDAVDVIDAMPDLRRSTGNVLTGDGR
tara:strand:+ start:8682 stop:9254 length:573 start_codon:yes stop_codon:yes gene_type:complete